MDLHFEYNTQREKMPLPEYGRSIQKMVDHALIIEDRAERQRCANTIVNIMGGMFPHLRDVPDFKHKLWDHLAIMSGFKLDIDYPYEVVEKNSLDVKPDRIPYQNSRIHYRHYGRLIESLVAKAVELPEGEEKNQLIRLIANHMKKDFILFNKDSVEDKKIFDDIEEYSNGAIHIEENSMQLIGAPGQQRNFTPRKRMANNNGPKRKY